MKQSNNYASRPFESSFPPDFRKDDIAALLAYVTSGKFAQLICLPGGGKATLLKILSQNQNVRKFHLKEKEDDYRFIYLNLLELEKYDQGSIDEFILHAISPQIKHSNDPITLSKQLGETVKKLAQNLTIVLLFDHFDEFQNQLSRSFFQRLRTVKNEARYKFACVFATRRDLRQLVDPEIRREFYDFFVDNSVYMNLYDEKATDFLFNQIENVLGKKISPADQKKIIGLTNGHTKITKACAEATLRETPIEKEGLLTNPLVRASLFELWLFLTAQEQHVLTQIVKDSHTAPNESTQNLINFGLLKPIRANPQSIRADLLDQQSNNSTIQQSGAPNNLTIKQFSNLLFTIPIFEEFVRANANTLHREKISYNQNTKEIVKGEEVISDLLSPQENRLLKYLIENEGRIIERDEIIRAVWPQALQAEGISDEAIDQMVFRIRKKIEDEPNNPKHISTVKGTGFRFSP